MKQAELGDTSIPGVTIHTRAEGVDPRHLEGIGPADLREYIDLIEQAGELKRITAEVDPIEEMAAIVYLAAREVGAPAYLFERVRGYSTGVLWNMWGSSSNRLATAMGLPMGLSLRELVLATRNRLGRRIAPVKVDSGGAAVFSNTVTGDEVDVDRFPAAKHWPLDGGRYIGTGDAVITRDPERGHLNVGTYRMMIHDRNHVGLYMSPGKDARLQMERWWKAGKPCEVVAVWGVDPATFLLSGITMPKTESEYDYIGGLKGEAVELLQGQFTDLLFPAGSEIVMEGVAYPNDYRKEGPFGEFTGYYGRPNDPAPQVEIKAIHFRDDPILTAALMSDHWASNDSALQFAVVRSARIWNDLDRLGIPGIKGVYAHPAAAGGFGMNVVARGTEICGARATGLGNRRTISRGCVFQQVDRRRRRRHRPDGSGPGRLGHGHTLQPDRQHRHTPKHMVDVAGSLAESAREKTVWLESADQCLHGPPAHPQFLEKVEAAEGDLRQGCPPMGRIGIHGPASGYHQL